MMQRIIAAALVAAALPLATAAQTCPTRDDLTTGVRLTRGAPFLTSLTTRSDGTLTEEREYDANGVRVRDSSTYAHPLTLVSRTSDLRSLTIEYQQDTFALDEIDKTLAWTSDVTLLTEGEQVQLGTLTFEFVGGSVASWGSCTYTIWILDQVLDLGETQRTVALRVYAPDLGLSVGWDQFDQNEKGRSAVDYDSITAE